MAISETLKEILNFETLVMVAAKLAKEAPGHMDEPYPHTLCSTNITLHSD